MNAAAAPLVRHFSALAPQYDVALCDVWGVMHNGIAAFPEAGEALSRFRAGGGTVILISNAPRPGAVVETQLDKLGVVRSAFDGIETSGDVTRREIAQRQGKALFHLGPSRDHSIFDGLGARFASPDDADYVVCSGLYDDERESPDDYRELLGRLLGRSLFMICANPDIVVERGDQLVYCAGAIADLYASLGGNVLYAGKPHRPIYEAALAKVAAVRGEAVTLRRVIAIGDSVRTDLKGAADFGVDLLFVTAGIHAGELGRRDNPDVAGLQRMFDAAGVMPKAVTPRLVW